MRGSNNNGSENGNEIEAKEIILREVQNVHDSHSEVRQDGLCRMSCVIHVS
jgi:hypothetical protein